MLLVVCSQHSSAFLCIFALFVLARDKVHLERETYLIVVAGPDCIGGGLGRAWAVPWLPVGQVCSFFIETSLIRQL